MAPWVLGHEGVRTNRWKGRVMRVLMPFHLSALSPVHHHALLPEHPITWVPFHLCSHHLQLEAPPHLHSQSSKWHSKVPTTGSKFWSKKLKLTTSVSNMKGYKSVRAWGHEDMRVQGHKGRWKLGIWVPSTSQCKKFKEVWLQHVGVSTTSK